MNGRNDALEPGVCMLWQSARTQTVDKSVVRAGTTSQRSPSNIHLRL